MTYLKVKDSLQERFPLNLLWLSRQSFTPHLLSMPQLKNHPVTTYNLPDLLYETYIPTKNIKM